MPGRNFDLWEVASHLIALAVAYALALPIGWNREHEARSAGLRTFPLVAIASCGFVIVAIRVLGQDSAGQARIIEGLITGVGFIGGGAILKRAGGTSGTATAASLWATGALGADSDGSRPLIPRRSRPAFRFDVGHHSEMKPATR